jgi:hypothetical protein
MDTVRYPVRANDHIRIISVAMRVAFCPPHVNILTDLSLSLSLSLSARTRAQIVFFIGAPLISSIEIASGERVGPDQVR